MNYDPFNNDETMDFGYFLPKKDMMFPCPGFLAIILAFPNDGTVAPGARPFRATGSSSEKDSHTGSSFVTTYWH